MGLFTPFKRRRKNYVEAKNLSKPKKYPCSSMFTMDIFHVCRLME